MNNMPDTNPWAGLSSYQDPETSDVQLKFCGRDNESFDVAQLIDNNIFVTLYGKSGTGKTSLLNAGVFPRLRREQYMPVNIRLSMDAMGISFQQCIEDKISQALHRHGSMATIGVVPLPADNQAPEYLWSYFARSRFTDADGRTLFPVIVLDQFEEVLRQRREETEALLKQMHFMMDESHALSSRTVDGQPYQYDFNFRFVACIREDDLYSLEDCIDNNFLNEMKGCRYRLCSLSQKGARDAILIPGQGLFREQEQETIVEAIINKARNDDGTISTNIISLLCSRIYVDFQKSGADAIGQTLVDSFMKGNPFERFYNEATRGFSNKEKGYIETHFVDSSGRRNSISESDFLLRVQRGAELLEGSRKILQRSSTSSGSGQFRLELIHDSFCEPLARMKEKRERQRRRRWFIIAAVITMASLAIGAYFIYLYSELRHSKAKIEQRDDEIDEKEQTISEQDSIMLGLGEKASAFDAAASILQYIWISDSAKYDYLKNYISNTPALKPFLITDDIKYLGDGAYMNDGIVYSITNPSTDQIEEWLNGIQDICKQKINGTEIGFDIPQEMLRHEPAIAYLILKSRSLNDHIEKQNWFNLWSIMSKEQTLQLASIIYRENYKLAQTSIFTQLSSLNKKAYEEAKEGNYEKAIETIDEAIKIKPDEAFLYDSKGEFLLNEGDERGAVKMWRKVIDLAPDFLDNYNGGTELYKQLVERGLIEN